MAEQILTQVEVDALLKGLSNGDIKTEAEKKDAGANLRYYDFSNQEIALRSKMPTLDMINEKFIRSIRTSILNLMRKTVDVTHEGIKTIRYEEFLRNLQMPSSLNIFQMNPLRGHGLLVIDPNLVYLIVDSYFGGDGTIHTRIEGRDFTNVEQAVVRKVVDIIFAEMKEVWRPVIPVDFKFIRAEMNPQFVNIIGHLEYVVVSTFRMEIESTSSNFFFCIPYSTLDPIKDKLYGTHKVDSVEIDKKWGERLMEQFSNVPLTLTCEIGRVKINVSELANLRAGDIITLNKKTKEPVVVSIEGIPKLAARPGQIDNNYAFKITSTLNERG